MNWPYNLADKDSREQLHRDAAQEDSHNHDIAKNILFFFRRMVCESAICPISAYTDVTLIYFQVVGSSSIQRTKGLEPA